MDISSFKPHENYIIQEKRSDLVIVPPQDPRTKVKASPGHTISDQETQAQTKPHSTLPTPQKYDNQEKRGRPQIDDGRQRVWNCGCGKCYLTYGALYSHTRVKHGGVQPPSSTRLRKGDRKPRKDIGVARRVKTESGGHKRDDNTQIRDPWEVDWIEYLHTLFTGRDKINDNDVDQYFIDFLKKQVPQQCSRAYKELIDEVLSIKNKLWEQKEFSYSKDTFRVLNYFHDKGVRLNCYQLISLFLYSIARFTAINVFQEISAILGDFLQMVNDKGEKYVKLEGNSFCSEINAEILPELVNTFLQHHLEQCCIRHLDWIKQEGLPGNLLGNTSQSVIKTQSFFKLMCRWLKLHFLTYKDIYIQNMGNFKQDQPLVEPSLPISSRFYAYQTPQKGNMSHNGIQSTRTHSSAGSKQICVEPIVSSNVAILSKNDTATAGNNSSNNGTSNVSKISNATNNIGGNNLHASLQYLNQGNGHPGYVVSANSSGQGFFIQQNASSQSRSNYPYQQVSYSNKPPSQIEFDQRYGPQHQNRVNQIFGDFQNHQNHNIGNQSQSQAQSQQLNQIQAIQLQSQSQNQGAYRRPNIIQINGLGRQLINQTGEGIYQNWQQNSQNSQNSQNPQNSKNSQYLYNPQNSMALVGQMGHQQMQSGGQKGWHQNSVQLLSQIADSESLQVSPPNPQVYFQQSFSASKNNDSMTLVTNLYPSSQESTPQKEGPEFQVRKLVKQEEAIEQE